MSTNPNVELDRRMRMMLSAKAYEAWRAKEDARLVLVRRQGARQ